MHLAHGLSMQGMSRSRELDRVAPKSWLSLLKKKQKTKKTTYFYLFYLAVLGLSYDMWALVP